MKKIIVFVALTLLTNCNEKQKTIDFPEEIDLTKKGDLLRLEKVTNDTIYIGFENKHHCNWEDCSYENKKVNVKDFKSSWGYDEGTDGYYCELIHVENPNLTYEQCEDLIFNPNK